MSRYIDAEQLWKYADNQKDKSVSANDFMRFPYIDIVHCRECKYKSICNHGVQHTTRDMSSVTIGYKAVDFCSYGER